MADRSVFVDASGAKAATDPHGLVRSGAKLCIVDYDSEKIAIIDKDDLENSPLAGN